MGVMAPGPPRLRLCWPPHTVGFLEHAVSELCFLERHKQLTEGRSTNTLKRRTDQGRNDVKRHPGQEASLAPSCSNLSFLQARLPYCCRKCLWHCWDFRRPTQWFVARGILPLFVTPLGQTEKCIWKTEGKRNDFVQKY